MFVDHLEPVHGIHITHSPRDIQAAPFDTQSGKTHGIDASYKHPIAKIPFVMAKPSWLDEYLTKTKLENKPDLLVRPAPREDFKEAMRNVRIDKKGEVHVGRPNSRKYGAVTIPHAESSKSTKPHSVNDEEIGDDNRWNATLERALLEEKIKKTYEAALQDETSDVLAADLSDVSGLDHFASSQKWRPTKKPSASMSSLRRATEWRKQPVQTRIPNQSAAPKINSVDAVNTESPTLAEKKYLEVTDQLRKETWFLTWKSTATIANACVDETQLAAFFARYGATIKLQNGHPGRKPELQIYVNNDQEKGRFIGKSGAIAKELGTILDMRYVSVKTAEPKTLYQPA